MKITKLYWNERKASIYRKQNDNKSALKSIQLKTLFSNNSYSNINSFYEL